MSPVRLQRLAFNYAVCFMPLLFAPAFTAAQSTDARHHFVLRAILQVPFKPNNLVEDGQFSAIVQAQTGNPVNIVMSSGTITGLAYSVRPNLIGPVAMLKTPDRWFEDRLCRFSLR